VDLTRKDEDRLAGKVLIYAKYVGEDTKIKLLSEETQDLETDMHVALILTNDVEYYADNEGLSIDQVLEKFAPDNPDIEQQLEDGEKMLIMPGGVSLYQPEEDLSDYHGDILYMGEFSRAKLIDDALRVGIDYYKLHLADQAINDIKKNPPRWILEKKKIISELENIDDSMLDYHDIEPDMMTRYIRSKYVNPMREAITNDDYDGFIKHSLALQDFTFNTLVQSHVNDLCAIIKTNNSDKAVELVLDMIDHTLNDRYEQVEECQKRLVEYTRPKNI
jgi:hypothetical protein